MAYSRAHRRNQGRMPTAPAARARAGARARAAAHGRQAGLGTWKLAYADFLTALAAFFLVMWLVKGMPESGRAEIAAYMQGADATATGQTGLEAPDPANALKLALETAPAILAHTDQVSVARSPDGLRIDLMDVSEAPLFEIGNAAATWHGETLMRDVFGSLEAVAWPMTLEGHTDAFAFKAGASNNFSLSANRAERARQIAMEAGIHPGRFLAITGHGDRRPRLPGEPHHPSNRRVTVILHVPSKNSIPVSS